MGTFIAIVFLIAFLYYGYLDDLRRDPKQFFWNISEVIASFFSGSSSWVKELKRLGKKLAGGKAGNQS